MDAESAGTHSAKRTLPFYDYHKLESGVLLVAVAADPDVVRGLRVSSIVLTVAFTADPCSRRRTPTMIELQV